MQPKSLEDLSRIPLSIVTFNYDRSLEYFLMTALRNSLGANEDETAQALAEIPIVHVYGQLGRPHFWDPDGREYNPNRTSAIIQKCADHVTILREQDRTTPEFEKAQTLILQAALVCFLGFGYHPVNLERLNLPLTLSKQSVLGTAFGLARDERRRVRGQFGQCRRTVRLTLGNEDEDALEFLRAYPVFD
jgi:hypothetical protein